MFAGRPIIGLAGGIGSGKTYVARFFGELGCRVIDSDAQVLDAYREPEVRDQLRQWWGEEPFTADGGIDRRAIGRRVFSTPADRQRLERLLHPRVAAARDREMAAAAEDPRLLAFVWDTPLLFETGLNRACDALVFVDADPALRRERVKGRGWGEAELAVREKLQWPLDKKRELSDYVLRNAADADDLRNQVRETLSQILATTRKPDPA